MAASKTTVMRVNLTGDSAGAVAALKKLSAQLAATEGDYKAVADAIYKESQRIEAGLDRTKAGGGKSAPDVRSLQTRATDRITDLADSAGLGEFSDDIGAAVGKLGGLGTAMAGATVVAVALGAALVKVGQFSLGKLTEIAPQIDQLAGTMRISTEEATRFWYALQAKGVDTTQAIDGLVQMQTNLTAAPEKFRALGIEQARFADGSADLEGTLMNVAAAWRSGDAAQRASVGSIALGEEAYRELMPLLSLTNAEFDALKGKAGNVLSPEDTAAAQQYSQAVAEAKTQLGLLGTQVGAELAPYVVVLAQGLNDVAANAGKVADILGPAVTIGTEILKAGLESIPGAGNLAGRAAVFVGEQWVDAAGDVKESASLIGAAKQALNAGMADFAGLLIPEAEQKRVAGLRGDLVSSYQAISDAKMTVAEAATGYADAEADASASVQQANAAAEQSIINAAQNVEDARQGQADAVNDLAKAERDAARTMADAAKSADKQVATASKRLEDAREKRIGADKDLAKTEVDVQRDLAEAAEDSEKRIVDATRNVTDAREQARRTERDGARSLADARSAYQDALLGSLTEDNPYEAQRDREKALLDLQRTEEDVTEANKDAASDVKSAEEDLRDAHVQAADDRARAEEQATERIEQARNRQTEAVEGVLEAEAGLEEAIVSGEDAKARAAESAASQIEGARLRVTAASRAVDTAEATYKQQYETAQAARAKATEEAATRIEEAQKRVKEAATAELLHELEVARIRRQIANPNFVDYMALSESNFTAESDTAALASVPRFHGGGVFHASNPGGEGLAILQDGEKVLTPGQAAGTVINLNVAGSVVTMQQLAEELSRLKRNGGIGPWD